MHDTPHLIHTAGGVIGCVCTCTDCLNTDEDTCICPHCACQGGAPRILLLP